MASTPQVSSRGRSVAVVGVIACSGGKPPFEGDRGVGHVLIARKNVETEEQYRAFVKKTKQTFAPMLPVPFKLAHVRFEKAGPFAYWTLDVPKSAFKTMKRFYVEESDLDREDFENSERIDFEENEHFGDWFELEVGMSTIPPWTDSEESESSGSDLDPDSDSDSDSDSDPGPDPAVFKDIRPLQERIFFLEDIKVVCHGHD